MRITFWILFFLIAIVSKYFYTNIYQSSSLRPLEEGSLLVEDILFVANLAVGIVLIKIEKKKWFCILVMGVVLIYNHVNIMIELMVAIQMLFGTFGH